ncbi:major facilitator superfamily domain-containing protein [Phthorimaea operculella]|nr:major facilitator superfamily domain-containing protein [Phthorimaea operculella]
MEKEKQPVTSDPEQQKRKVVDLDTILTEELGQFGWYQARMMLLAFVIVMFSAWAAVEYIFTTARIETRCLIPECEVAVSAQFRPPWLSNAVPPSGNGFSNCQRFANLTTPSTIPISDSCPATLFDRQRQVDCEEFLYSNSETIVYDFELACDEWRRTLIGTVRTAGVFVAMPLAGYISDRWGRRTALVICSFNTAWLGAVRYFTNTYIGFIVSEFFEAVLGAGAFTSAYILVMELMGPKYRVAGGVMMNTFFALGQVTMGLIAWAVPTWRELTLALYLPQLISVCYFWLMSESIRWYMSKGRFEDSERVLRRVAKANGKQLSETSLRLFRKSAEEEKLRQAEAQEKKKDEPWLIVLVFRNKPILLRCCVSPVWWITMTFIYYGLSINSVNLSGNKYLNYVAVSAVEIPGYWAAFFLLGIIGRKPVLAGAFWICAACQAGYIFMPDGQFAVSLTLYLIGKLAISVVVTAMYVYTAELYPTQYRNSLFAFSSMMGRIGAMVAPLTPAFGAAVWDDLPFALFGGFALVAGLLVLVTPETLGTKFPDTMQEAADLGKTQASTASKTQTTSS